MTRDLPALALALLSLSACGATKEIGQIDEGSGDGDDSATDPTQTESDTQHMCGFETGVEEGSNCIPETGDDGEETDACQAEDGDDCTASMSAEGGTDTGGCGASVCDPQPDDSTEAFFIIDGDFDRGEVSDLELPCTIESVEGDGHVTVTLSCTVAEEVVARKIVANVPTTLGLVPGTAVNFSHFVWQPFWTEQWFSLRLTTEGVDPLIMAGIRGSTLLPQPIEEGLVLLSEPFYGHVGLAVQDGVCGVEPVCDANDCAQERRQAIAVSTDTEALVYDRSTAHVGELSTVEVRVEDAVAFENVVCSDLPPTEYSVLVVNVGDG